MLNFGKLYTILQPLSMHKSHMLQNLHKKSDDQDLCGFLKTFAFRTKNSPEKWKPFSGLYQIVTGRLKSCGRAACLSLVLIDFTGSRLTARVLLSGGERPAPTELTNENGSRQRPTGACSPRRRRQRWVPRKNRATVPGPEWAPITGPMKLMRISFTPILLLTCSATY